MVARRHDPASGAEIACLRAVVPAMMRVMGRLRVGRAAVVYGVLQAASAALALWLAWRFDVASVAATAIALAPTAPASFLAWLAYRDDRREAADPAAKTAMLAAAVAAAETRQRAQLIGEGAHRIDLTYRYRPEVANNAAGAAASGRLSDITAYYRSIRPARLVVTGAPGAGKTVLALDLVLGLLTDPARTDTDPVPVRISLAGWDTERPLGEWLLDQVHRRFRDRGLTVADAEVLVEQRRILPVLDGLDEMDNDTIPVPRRRAVAALRQLNAYQDSAGSAPVILTCRSVQYAELAALDVRMREAARVEIEPVTPAQAGAYLTARGTDPIRWAPVIHTLHTAPGGTLARSLDTPWRLNLAATVYEERAPDTLLPVRRPDDLCALASPGAVRDHLLGLYVPAAVHQHPTRPGRYRPDATHRQLAALARHLATATPYSAARPGAGTDLVLHELWPMAGPLRVRATDTLLAAILTTVYGSLLLAMSGIGTSLPHLINYTALALLALPAILVGSSAAVAGTPVLHLHRLRSPGPHLAKMLRAGLALGVGLGLGVGLIIGVRLGFGLGYGLAVGLAVGFMFWLVLGLLLGLAEPLGDVPPADPRRPVRDDLTVGLAGGLALGLTSALVYGLVAGPVFGLTIGLIHGTIGLYVLARAGRRYLVFLYCARNRLPGRLGVFLNWCYGTGLLRISGVAYQFRHRELQSWLAAHPNP